MAVRVAALAQSRTRLVHATTKGVGRLLNNRRSARVRSEGTERSNPKTRTVFGTNPHQRPRTPAGANGAGRCPWGCCNGFSYSETDRGFGRVGVSLRALPYGVLAKVGPARLWGLVSGCYSD